MAKIRPLMLVPPVIFLGLAAMFLVGMQRDDPDALPSALAAMGSGSRCTASGSRCWKRGVKPTWRA